MKECTYDKVGAKMSRFVNVNLMMGGSTANIPKGDEWQLVFGPFLDEMARSTVQQ